MSRHAVDDLLTASLLSVKGIGPRRASELERAGLCTVEDFLYRFPLRYEDRSRVTPIARLEPGSTASVSGEIVNCGLRATRRPGFTLFELTLRDEAGSSARARFFNQRFLRDVFHPGQHVFLFGHVEAEGNGRVVLENPHYEIVGTAGERDQESATVHMGRIVPVYERVGSLTPKMQRAIVRALLDQMPRDLTDPLPADTLQRLSFPSRREALEGVHFPPEDTDVALLNAVRTPAHRRLAFEELFLCQAGGLLAKLRAGSQLAGARITVDDRIRQVARKILPFALTSDQKTALKEIVGDLAGDRPMNRLLQGDVGAGKTIVALIAALVVIENGFQAAFMAPTEILAEQHYFTIRKLFEPTGHRVGILTGAMSASDRDEVHRGLVSGELSLVVGTHTLLQDEVAFARLGFVVIDEQHRFGVRQRARLREKGSRPHVLVMTATPIPRTLALTAYVDLDLSTIRERPPGRLPIKTLVKPDSRREDVYAFVREELRAGRQAYVIYPIVEESDKIDLRAATAMADHLAAEVFPEFPVGLLHGRLPRDAKERVMRAFASGNVPILVSTTVIEVGIDVPNASVMVVEHAERFGLAQLHQLRGRVGRGSHASTCLLLYQPPLSDVARARLKALAETTDGFLLAERDLEIRGPGDFFGTRQSGLPTLRVADLTRDADLIELARQEAAALIEGHRPDAAFAGAATSAWQRRGFLDIS